MHQSEPASSPVGHRLPGYMEYQGVGSSPFRQQFPVERKWALGLQVEYIFGFIIMGSSPFLLWYNLIGYTDLIWLVCRNSRGYMLQLIKLLVELSLLAEVGHLFCVHRISW